MQGTNSFQKLKKPLFIVLGVLIVVLIAFATALILSKIIGPSTKVDTTPLSGDPLTAQLTVLYRDSSSTVNQTVTLDVAEVQESGTEGYKNAKAKIMEGEPNDRLTAIFYQTPDTTWHFFTVAKDQDTLSCTKYATQDLINAFIGFTCKGTTPENSFVQSAPEKFEVVPGSMGN